MTCKDLIEVLGEYLDAALGPEAERELERHLAACPACVAYLNTYRKAREVAHRAGQVEMPEEMRRAVKEFLLKKLAEAKE